MATGTKVMPNQKPELKLLTRPNPQYIPQQTQKQVIKPNSQNVAQNGILSGKKKKPTKELPTLADLMVQQAPILAPRNPTISLPKKEGLTLQQPNPASSYVVQRFRTERAYAKHKKLSPLKKGILKEREDEFLAKFGEELALEKKKETIEKLEKEAEEEAERRKLPVRRIGDREKKDKYLKSLPKLQFNSRVREYCTQLLTTEMEIKIIEFLQILTKYQERAMAERALASAREVQPKKKKRFVMGLKETLRGVKVGKVKMIICAPNIDPNPTENGLDVRIESIVESAELHNCPCVFGLNKKRLGNAVGKDIKISVVGIYNYDGADYKDVLVHARTHKLYYLLQQNALQQQKRIMAILEKPDNTKNEKDINNNSNRKDILASGHITEIDDDDGTEVDEIDVELNIIAEEQEELESELFSIQTTMLGLDRVGPGRPKPTTFKKDFDKWTIFLQRINHPNSVTLNIPKTLLISELKDLIQNTFKNSYYVPVVKQVLISNNMILEEDALENIIGLMEYATICVWSLKEFRSPVERAKHKLEPIQFTINPKSKLIPSDELCPSHSIGKDDLSILKADSKEFKPQSFVPLTYGNSYENYSYPNYYPNQGFGFDVSSYSPLNQYYSVSVFPSFADDPYDDYSKYR